MRPIQPGDTVLVARPLPCCRAGAGSIFVVGAVETRKFAPPKADADGRIHLTCTWCGDQVEAPKPFVGNSVTFVTGHPSKIGIGMRRLTRLEPLTESEKVENFTEIYGVGTR